MSVQYGHPVASIRGTHVFQPGSTLRLGLMVPGGATGSTFHLVIICSMCDRQLRGGRYFSPRLMPQMCCTLWRGGWRRYHIASWRWTTLGYGTPGLDDGRPCISRAATGAGLLCEGVPIQLAPPHCVAPPLPLRSGDGRHGSVDDHSRDDGLRAATDGQHEPRATRTFAPRRSRPVVPAAAGHRAFWGGVLVSSPSSRLLPRRAEREGALSSAEDSGRRRCRTSRGLPVAASTTSRRRAEMRAEEASLRVASGVLFDSQRSGAPIRVGV